MDREQRIQLLYVCDFRHVHARPLIDYFASRASFEVKVLTTFPADPMPGVEMVSLTDQPDRPRQMATKGWLGKLVYRFFHRFPVFLIWARRVEVYLQVPAAQKAYRNVRADFNPEIVHALRTQPEGLVAFEAKRSHPEVPLFLTTWGQDFVLFGGLPGGRLYRSMKALIRSVDVFLPDNPRDERIARDRFGLRDDALSYVMPAPGGLDVALLSSNLGRHVPEKLKGGPLLFSMRGYESAYIRIRVLIDAMPLFVRSFPNAHLFIDVRAGHADEKRDELTRKWVRDAGMEQHITLLHLTREEAFGYLQACDLYVSATISDGLPMSLLEGLYYGAIPVVKNHESTRNIACEAEGVITYERITPRDVAAAWEKAIGVLQRTDRAERTRRNQKVIHDKYERLGNLRILEELYRAEVHGRDAGLPAGSTADRSSGR